MTLRCGRKRLRSADPAQSGMTLIEMLVVLAIIGVTASLALLSIGAGGGTSGQTEAKRLESRLQLAADQSMMRDEVMAVSLTPHSYGFVRWDEAARKWAPSALASLGEIHELPSGMALASSDGQKIVPLGLDSTVAPVEFSLDAGRSHWAIDFDGLTAKTRTSLAKRP